MSTADLSHGITVTLETSAFSFLLRDVNVSGNARETVDVSHQGTTDWMDFLGSDLRDGGELTFTGLLDPGDDPDTMLTTLAEYVRIVWPDSTCWRFYAINTQLSCAAPHKDVMTIDLTFKVSGEPDFDYTVT